MNTPINEILKEMASLTALSGRISSIQIHNLKMFPLVFFDSIDQVRIDYDLAPTKTMDDEPTKNNLLVAYYLTLDESKNQDLDKRYIALEQSVRNLFWSDTIVEIYFNDQIKYKSKKNG
jgi:hypothetical protein